ncbi:copper transporter [Georgenia sp. AZ-5]|uniref:copper transporter n=1 Tax=Georgenia sp. AZ-5 TaxID=3367526 RepID=UPI003754FB64
MIDFRYHLVSLIAVFLALAVGIVLGAGPLRDTIGDTLTGQVEELRADRDQLRAELAGAEADVTERSAYLDASAPVLLDGALAGRDVAVVTLPGTTEDDVQEVRDRVGQAGAELVGEVAVTEAWTDPDNRSFRQSFAGQLLGYLQPAPAADAGIETIFGLALGHALTGAGPDGAPTPDAGTLLDLLTSADAPLVTITTEPSAAADATILVGPRPAPVPAEGEEDEEQAETVEAALTGHVQLAAALSGVTASVTVGAAATERDLVSAVRADDAAADSTTTVDSVGEVTAAISAPLALAVELSGATDHYGFQQGANEPVPPRVELEPAPAVEPAEVGAGEEAA